MNIVQHPDVDIAGAGVVGLSLALELRLRGLQVRVLDRDLPGLASRAAAGMLAAHDPHNPPALQPLANLALQLYPGFLDTVRGLSGHPVPIQTEHLLEASSDGAPGYTLLPTLAHAAGNFILRREQSLDPRDLHTALRAAVTKAGVFLQADTDLDSQINIVILSRAKDLLLACGNTKTSGEPDQDDNLPFRPETTQSHYGQTAEKPASSPRARETQARQHRPAPVHVDCTGAWSATRTRPARGQMLRVQLPPGTLQLSGNGNAVIRTGDFYIVPRLDGSALIGATVEDVGFDLTTRDADLHELRTRAAAILPVAGHAPELERWAGLRPRTADDLPILGRLEETKYPTSGLSDVGFPEVTGNASHYVANGLFRNGILLAPAVARVIAELLTGEPTSIPLAPFSPGRPSLH